MNLLSWNYLEDNNSKTKNDSNGLQPVNCSTSFCIAEKDKSLMLDVILVKEIMNNSDSLKRIGLSPNRIKNELKEASELCRYI